MNMDAYDPDAWGHTERDDPQREARGQAVRYPGKSARPRYIIRHGIEAVSIFF